jgi:lipid kinase YegS
MKTLLILNGKRTDPEELRESVHRWRDKGHEISVRVTWEKSDGIRFAEESLALGVERVIACGGDGTVNEVAQGLMRIAKGDRPALAIIPMGTANDFAVSCEFPESPEEALGLAIGGTPVPIDLVKVGDLYAINVTSFGYGAAVTNETPEELKRFFGGGAYSLMAILKILQLSPFPIRFVSPEHDFEMRTVVGAVCNGRQSGGGQTLAKEALLNDGMLDVFAIQTFPLTDFDLVLQELKSRPESGQYVHCFQTPWLEIESEITMHVNLDGEPNQFKRMKFEVVAGALDLVLPESCPCLKR